MMRVVPKLPEFQAIQALTTTIARTTITHAKRIVFVLMPEFVGF